MYCQESQCWGSHPKFATGPMACSYAFASLSWTKFPLANFRAEKKKNPHNGSILFIPCPVNLQKVSRFVEPAQHYTKQAGPWNETTQSNNNVDLSFTSMSAWQDKGRWIGRVWWVWWNPWHHLGGRGEEWSPPSAQQQNPCMLEELYHPILWVIRT